MQSTCPTSNRPDEFMSVCTSDLNTHTSTRAEVTKAHVKEIIENIEHFRRRWTTRFSWDCGELRCCLMMSCQSPIVTPAIILCRQSSLRLRCSPFCRDTWSCSQYQELNVSRSGNLNECRQVLHKLGADARPGQSCWKTWDRGWPVFFYSFYSIHATSRAAQ